MPIANLLLSAVLLGAQEPSPPLLALSEDFWVWRAQTQPASADDIPRIERPKGWVPDWSKPSVAARRRALSRFEVRFRAIDTTGWAVPNQVDYRLVGSALARVRWELDVNPVWRRDPNFYVQQTLGSLFEVLVLPPPLDPARRQALRERLQSIPRVAEQGLGNLDLAIKPFAVLAIDALGGVRSQLTVMAREVGDLGGATDSAIVALERFRAELTRRLPAMPARTAVGPERYRWFLSRVALVPFAPTELLAMGRQEWERSVGFEVLEKARNRGLPDLPLFPTIEANIAAQAADEAGVRRYLEDRRLLTVPGWVKHFLNAPVPGYLEPLAWLGVPDDLTGPSRLDQNGVHYIPSPSPNLGYFGLSMAKDPRGIIVHEGVPGHYFQLVLSWAHENPIRRRYYDSGSNEGIGFYAEEMMLQAGLFDDRARSKEIIYNFMRLRALRVEVDVRLATGEFTITEAADYLRRTVPMDQETALAEAASFAAGPGLAITYQIGKLQITKMLADAKRQQGDQFDLRAFHDFVWKNGNVPLSLVRWELLGLRDEVARVDRNRRP